MTRTGTSPLDGVDRLLVDGTNLLHALSRGPSGGASGGAGSAATAGPGGGAGSRAAPGGPAPLPPAALIGRLRGAIPPAVAIELVLDGAPEPGMRGARIASGVLVRYGGRRTADDLILALVDEARAATGSAGGADNILVVSDDRELRTALRTRGAATAGAAWLVGRLQRTTLASPSAGNRRPPVVLDRTGPDVDGGRRWQPGRGATTKRGNPRRRPRTGQGGRRTGRPGED